MAEIGGLNTGVTSYANALTSGTGGTAQTNTGTNIGGIDSATLLAEFQRLAATMSTQSPSGGGVPGVSTSNGAPMIDGVQVDFSAEDMAAALLVLQGKTQEAQLSTAKEGLMTSKKKLEDKNQQAMNKINEWIKKCEEAAAKEKAAGIFGWLVKIFSVLAAAIAVAVAAVATVASGGAAAPLLAMAIMAMVGAVMSLASQISQSAGGPPLELSTLMAKLCTKILEAFGVPKEDAEKFGKTMSGMAALVCPAVLIMDPGFAGNLVGGFAEICGADKDQAAIVSAVVTAVAAIAVTIAMIVATGGMGAAAAVEGISKTIMTAGQIGQAVAGVASGASTITQGALNISKAGDEKAAGNIQADKKMIDAMIAKLQKMMEDDREEIKKVMQEIMDGIGIVTKMIAAAGDSRSQIAHNLSAGKAQTI